MNPIPNETSSPGRLPFFIANLLDEPATQAEVHEKMGSLKNYPQGTIGNRIAEEYSEYERSMA
jgi:hypothetical protein